MRHLPLAAVMACATPSVHVAIRPLPPAQPPASPPVIAARPSSPLAVDDTSPAWGNRDAPVTMVVFVDLLSPWTTRLWPALVDLRAAYPADRLRIVIEQDPMEEIHPAAALPAEAAHGVFVLGGAEVLWKFLGLALASRELRTELTRDQLVAWARDAGVTDVAALEHGMDTRQWAGKIERDQLAAKHASVDGVPTSFINGIVVHGARPAESFRGAIDAELAAAAELRATGIAPEAISAIRTRANFGSAPAQDRTDVDAAIAAKRHPVSLDGAPALGPSSALVTVVAYGDPPGNACGSLLVWLGSLRVRNEDDVRIVWRDVTNLYPAHRTDAEANFLAEVRAQKGDAAFWTALGRFCPATEAAPLDAPFDELARELGADVVKTRRAVQQRTHQLALEADTDLAADLGAREFSLYVDGRLIQGDVKGLDPPALVYDEDALATVLEQELNRSRALVRAGTPRDRLYAKKLETAEPLAIASFHDDPPRDAPSFGAPTAPLVVEELLQLPCRDLCREDREALRHVLDPFGGRVRLVVRVWSSSLVPLAGEAALEVFAQRGAAVFTRFVDATGDGEPGPEQLAAAAQKLGVDMKRYQDALARHVHAAAVEASAAVAKRAAIRDHGVVLGAAVVEVPQRPARYRTLVERALKAVAPRR